MLIDLLKEVWLFTREVSVYLLGGFLLAGVVRVFFTEKTIAAFLGRGGLRPVFWASLIGVPLPLCSCSVLPTAAALRKGGATRAATTSFLISTPETGVDSIAVSYAMLDPLLTIARPLAALATALVTGAAQLFLNPEPEPVTVPSAASPDTPRSRQPFLSRLGAGIHYSFFVLLADIAWYLAWGLVLAGLVAWIMPPDLLTRLPGGKWASIAAVIGIGIPLYICATSSTPLAAALIAKGLSPGVALLLLLVGPATNLASLSVVWRLLGLRALVIYLAGITVTGLVCCFVLDYLYGVLGIDPAVSMGAAAEVLPGWLQSACAVVLCALIAYGIYKEKIRPRLRRRSL